MRRCVLFFLFAIAGACAVDDDAAPTVRMQLVDDGVPGLDEFPFPTDLWFGAQGKLSEAPDLGALFGREADTMAGHLALLDGFGTRSQVQFPMTGAIDPGSLPATTSAIDDPIVVINLQPESDNFAQVVPYEWRYESELLTVQGAPRPGTVLESDATYAAVLTSDISGFDGSPLSPSPALALLRRSLQPDNRVSTADGLALLESMPAFAGRIAGFTVFKVQDALQPLLAARAMLDDRSIIPPPTVEFNEPETIFAGQEALDALLGVATREEQGGRAGLERWGHGNPTGIAHEHVGVVASGEFHLPFFRRAATGDLSETDGTFELDADKVPLLQSTTSIPITLVLPAAAAPEGGYPVVLFGHGLGSSRHAVLSFAEPLASEGIAVLAIDFDGHGSRFNPLDKRNNTAETTGDFQGDASIRDGFGDITGLMTTFDFLGGLRNFSRARDGIRQSVLDISALTLALRRGDVDLSTLAGDGPVPTLNTERISYMGESFGTIVGGVLAAIEPEIELYILDVPAAGIVDLAILNSPALASLLLPLTYSIFGWVDLPTRFDPKIALLQAMVDAADPLTFAPHVLGNRLEVNGTPLGPRHVVALEVLGDEAIHNLATDSLARAMGLELLVPFAVASEGLVSVDSPASANVAGQTGVIVQYGPAVHGENWSSEHGEQRFVPGFPHDEDDPFPSLDEPLVVANPIYETLEQVVEVLLGHQRGEAPQVRSTSNPRL